MHGKKRFRSIGGHQLSAGEPYNPLAKQNLGASVAEALLSRPVEPLASPSAMAGAGIYTIYYSGAFPEYEPIAKRNRGDRFEAPIYIGKAVPEGARKGTSPIRASGSRKALINRLLEHAESVEKTSNLSLADFHCRYLIVDDIWIPLAESLLINKFLPVWNTIVDGFGNHDPGKGRYEGKRPRWDVIHPGRAWASRCAERPETAKQILTDVAEHLRSQPIPKHPHFFAMQARADYDVG